MTYEPKQKFNQHFPIFFKTVLSKIKIKITLENDWLNFLAYLFASCFDGMKKKRNKNKLYEPKFIFSLTKHRKLKDEWKLYKTLFSENDAINEWKCKQKFTLSIFCFCSTETKIRLVLPT